MCNTKNWPPVGDRVAYTGPAGTRKIVHITAHGRHGVCVQVIDTKNEFYVSLLDKTVDVFEPVTSKDHWCLVADAILNQEMQPGSPPKGDVERLYTALESGLLFSPK